MKILHTSDLHLGKRLAGKSRLDEQREVLEEIIGIVREEEVSVVLIAGDIFDTPVPPSEAEELFYSFLLKLSRYALPVVIAGNHDDATRLRAPSGIAKASGIVLSGDEHLSGYDFTTELGVSVKGGEGFVRIEREGERLNLALLNYPTNAKLMDMAGEEDYTEFVMRLTKDACSCFTEGDINIFMSHLYVISAKEEGELGGSKLIPVRFFDIPLCDYIALGHIHNSAVMSKSKKIYYCGAPLYYSFDDDANNKKRVIVLDFEGERRDIKERYLTKVKRLCKVTVSSEEQATDELNKRADELVWLCYDGAEPLSPRAVTEFKKHACYCGISVISERTEVERKRRGLTDEQLFTAFYESRKKGEKPTAEMVEMFLSAVSGEDF